jgi:hypothetical protein
MARSIIFTIVLLISLTSYSQCDSRKIETDSCGTMVLLTTDDFTEFYVAKRTLKQISKEFPELKNNLKKAEKALKKEKEITNLKIQTTKKTLEEIKDLVTKIEIEKLKIEQELENKNKLNAKLFLISIAQGAILLITFTLIISK